MTTATRKIALLLADDRAAYWHDQLTPQLPPAFTLHVCTDTYALDAVGAEIVIGQQDTLLDLLAAPQASLRWVHILSAGVDRAVAAVGKAPQFRMTSVSGIHAASMREYVLTAMLHFTKGMRQLEASASAHSWSPRPLALLDGSTLLSIGTGAIGSAVATAAKTLGVATIGVSRHGRAADGFDRVATISHLSASLSEADFVLLALPLTIETRDLFGAAQFAAMKPGAVLINIARGALIDDTALLASLDNGHLAGAALDVFREEPLPASSRYWSHPNVLVTPHVSGRFARGHELAVRRFVENIGRYIAGEPLDAEIDLTLGY